MIRFRTLGSIDLTNGDISMSTVLAQPKRLALLAYLATARPIGFHSRDTLLALFWPESDSERARNSLRQALHHLRRNLGESAIVSRGERDIGVDPAFFDCDAIRFDDAIESGRHEEALSEYHGDFLPGLHAQDADEALRWIDSERGRRKRAAFEAARSLADGAESVNDHVNAVRWSRRALELEPTDESAIRRLLESLEASGDVAGAMDTFADFARRLDAEFGIKPSIETTRLVQRITERPMSTTAELVALAPRNIGAPAAGISIEEDAATNQQMARRLPRRWLSGAIAVAVAAIAGWYAWHWSNVAARRSADAGNTQVSLAVLPFVNMSGDADNEFLADGMTEELLNLLAQRPELQVASRTSAFAFKNRGIPIDSIARVLRVQHVVEGSVRESGGQWRFTVQLIDAATGFHRWSGTFDTRMSDIIAVQDSIGRAIVDQLRVQLAWTAGDSAQRGLTRNRVRAPRDPAAHIAAMKGWRVFRLNTPDAYTAAANHFDEAIRRDPTYGYAYAGLATVRHWQGYFRQIPMDSGYELGRTLANRALALDSSLTDAWIVLGRTAEVRDRDYALAAQYYHRAIDIAPSDSRPYSRRAALLARLGQPDSALASARRAVDLDPASPGVYADLANLYGDLNRFSDAEKALRQALALDPGHPILLGNLAIQLANQTRYQSADSVMQQVRKLRAQDPIFMGQHAFILANLRQQSHARALLDSAERSGLSRVELATTYLVLGDTAAVYRNLERALSEHDDGLAMVLDTAAFSGLRAQPRYQRIVERVRAQR